MSTGHRETMLRLWPLPESPRAARLAVARLCEETGNGRTADAAALLTSELVTNAVRHAATMITVVARCDGASITVAVHDHLSDVPLRREPEPSAEGGRGIAVVDAVAGAWGVRPTDLGKTVWFRLP